MGATNSQYLTPEELEEQRRREEAQQQQQQQEPPKTAAELVQRSTDQQVETLKGAASTFEQNTKANLEEYKGNVEQQAKDIESLGEKQSKDIRAEYDAIYGPEGTLTKAYEARQTEYENEVEDDKQRKKTDYNTAMWSGITEFASALVNLGMVVGAGANSISVPEYSKDWMKKADADAKERRQRLDRMRDNITAQQERLEAARHQGSLAAMAKLHESQNKAIDMRGKLNEVEYGAKQQVEGTKYQSATQIAGAQAQGGYHMASIMQHDKDRAITSAQHAASMRMHGYNPNGTVNEDYMKTRMKYSGITGERKQTGETYRVARKDGSEGFVRMSKETRKRALLGAGEELKKDILRDANFTGTWEEFVEATGKKKAYENGKKIPNPLYGKYDDIIAGLNSTGDERYEAIEAYLEQHPNSWEVGELLSRYNGVVEQEEEEGGGEVSADALIARVNNKSKTK